MKHYKYRLAHDITFTIPELEWTHAQFNFVTIERGTLTIRADYCWDGCSPKKVLSLGPLVTVVGTPDGPLRHGKPWTNDASLVHDVLCQYRHRLPLTKAQVVGIFERMLRQVRWPATDWYVYAVDRWGPQDFPPGTYFD